MADAAIELLLREIRDKGRVTRTVFDHVVAHQLVQRDSVAPPQKRPVGAASAARKRSR
jgi:LacI family transcriptional regulator